MTDSSKGVLLVVDDEPLKRATLQIELSGAGYTVFEAADAMSASKVIETRPVDAVITDVRMPEVDGIQLLEMVKSRSPRTHVILMTAYGSVDAAVEAIKRGAYDYITKPFPTEALVEKIERLLACRAVDGEAGENGPEVLGRLVGQSHASRRLFEQIRAVADNDRTILVEGEIGTCRDRAAEALHQLSKRSAGPLVKFSCAASSPEAIEAELFGRGTGSGGQRAGRLEEAAGGTLFIDEVESLPIELQARLLLAMDEKAWAGDSGRIALDARLIFGTQTNLRRQVDAGRFREDLYYRLDAVHLVVPPLRDRREDIPALATHYLKNCAKADDGKPLSTRISTNVMDMLMTYHWPGNVSELENVLERAVAFAGSQEIQPRDVLLPAEHRAAAEDGVQPSASTGLTETIAGVEQSLIDAALRRAAGNQARAAQFLGIPRTTLRDKMAKYGMVGKAGKKEVAQ